MMLGRVVPRKGEGNSEGHAHRAGSAGTVRVWRVFELSYGKPADTIELYPVNLDSFITQMTSAERDALTARLIEQHLQLIGGGRAAAPRPVEELRPTPVAARSRVPESRRRRSSSS
jgi:hypothetical protein